MGVLCKCRDSGCDACLELGASKPEGSLPVVSFAPEPLQGVLRLAPGLLYHPESQGPYCLLGRLWFLSCVAFQVS